MYNIVSRTYEGPFDILLELVKDDEIDVSRITIRDIIDNFKMLSVDESSDFILNAANLIYLKSLTLLPNTQSNQIQEENTDIEKLLEQYKKFKEIAYELERKEGRQKDYFYRTVNESSAYADEEFVEATLVDLLSAFKKVLAYLPKDEVLSITKESITVKQKINEILDILTLQDRIDLVELLKKQPYKEHVITAFLAILELIKLGLIICKQNVINCNIYLIKKT